MAKYNLSVFLVLVTTLCTNQRAVQSSGLMNKRNRPNTFTTDTDMVTVMNNQKTSTGKRVTSLSKDPIDKNHSCLPMEAISCECLSTVGGILVNCSNRNLSRVPENIPTNTVVLILSDNKIENISVGVFKNLTRIKQMDLSGNEISIFEDGIFTGLDKLETLHLQDNPFSLLQSAFGDNVFSPLKMLRELNLKSRIPDTQGMFNYPDRALGKLTSLQALIIDGLDNTTFGEGFQNMTSLRTLDLSLSPQFQSISKYTFRSFQNITVKNLLLNNGSLTWIHPEALKYFPKIDTIDYSHNIKLEIKGVGESFFGLQNTTIRKIVMQRVHSKRTLTYLSKTDIIYLTNTKLEEMYVDHNSLALIIGNALHYFPRSIKIASTSYNMIQTSIQQMWSFLLYRNLTEINFSFQETYFHDNTNYYEARQTDFLNINHPFYTKSEINGFPNIAEVSTGLNIFAFDPSNGYSINFPPNLWSIQCSNTYKLQFVIPKISLTNASVTHVDFSYNLLHQWEGPLLGLQTLLHLNLSGNECDYVSSQFFAFLPNLQTLRIAHNRFGPELKENTFYNLTSLKILDMHNNLQENTKPTLFSRLMELVELDISSNYLTSWEADISSLVNLSRLDLKDNKFSSLSKNLRDNLDVISKFQSLAVDISGNPLNCICDTKDFVLWFTQTKARFANLTSTLCNLENGTSLSLTQSNAILRHLQNHCRSYTIVIVVTSVCVGLSLVILIGFIIHRNRWKIRYLLYVTLNRKERTGYQRLEGNPEESQYFYDAFISYEDSSRHFIVDELIPRLETGFGLKLCIDKRDFVPGLYVTDNIMHAISNSRNTVVFLTKEFLKSKWCMYELNMARMEALFNDRQTLIVVLLEDIPTKSLPREILDLFRQQTYIEMVDDEYGAELFWNRLICAIKIDY